MTWQGHILPEHHIEHVFTVDDTKYFKFTDVFNIPCERAMDALQIYEEFKNRIDNEFLKVHLKAKDKIYNSNPIKLFEIKKLDDQLRERLTMAMPPNRIIENLATVLYFDETENPYKYDRAYAERKKTKWREGKLKDVEGVEKAYDFFLSQRLLDLMPSLDLPEEDIQSYLRIAQLVDNQHLKTIYSNLSSKEQNNALFKTHWFTNDLKETSV